MAVLALLVVGCADGGASGGSSSTEPSPTEPSPTESSEPPSESPSGPAPTDHEPGDTFRGLPDGVDGTMNAPAGAGWSPVDGRLFVVTYGSSSCPRLAEPDADWDDGHENLVVRLVDPPADKACTMDYAPTTSVVAVPDDVDASAPVPVRITGEGAVEVEPRPAPGEPGPIAWQSGD